MCLGDKRYYSESPDSVLGGPGGAGKTSFIYLSTLGLKPRASLLCMSSDLMLIHFLSLSVLLPSSSVFLKNFVYSLWERHYLAV